MHPCPCCGYRTLPGRGDYDLCPVCSWEDDGAEPWAVSGPNGQTLLEAQHEYLTDPRPHRRREGRVRPPQKAEARDPDWSPIERTPELIARADEAVTAYEREIDQDRRRLAEKIAADRDGPMQGYDADVRALRAQAPDLRHREVKDRLRRISDHHDMPWSAAHLELLARLIADPQHYQGHPVRTGAWLLRYARPRTYRQRWAEVRTGTISFAR
jgi:hypothetical protein